ncbi:MULTISPECIES: substrate binding domain-containing protein [unclassified Pseudomonas]|uniref:substrate binding domain-containing protein n=1 Tax=unclassified Pseudomonas TaxID=196821 RepID=UPI0039B72D80
MISTLSRVKQHALRRFFAEAEAIEQRALAARSGPSGVLKVTAAVTLGTYVIAPQLVRFRERFPEVTIDFRLSDTLTDLVEEGIDVAVPIGQLADSRLIARKLAANRVCAFASPSYMKCYGTHQHPDDLFHHQCINVRFKSSGQDLRWPFTCNGKPYHIEPRSIIVANNNEAVATIIASGAGIGVSPSYLAAAYVKRGELVAVMPECWAEPNHITALWPENRRGNPTVQALVSFLDEIFPDPTLWNLTIFGGESSRTAD